MARPVVLSNGSMFVGLNEQGLVHDFYYPYVGLDNLTTSRTSPHRVGVFVDGAFSWVGDEGWDCDVNFEDTALMSNITAENAELGIRLHFADYVDSQYNVFSRDIKVTNLKSEAREIRFFMHQIFQISRGGRADTALFEPEDHYILDYKGRCCLLSYGQFEDGQVFDQYSIGNYGIEGKEGTYKDAEDGTLSGNAVEHGGVDSVIGFTRTYMPEQTNVINYWVIAADAQSAAEGIHKTLLAESAESRSALTKEYWKDWLSVSDSRISAFDEDTQVMLRKSLLVIKSHIDRRGGLIASGDSSIYNYGRDYYSYVWPRDGAYVLWPLIQLGYTEEPRKFFEFCRDILTSDGYLMHKYQPDKAVGSSWHPLVHGNHSELAIQEDETAIVIIMLSEFLKHNSDQEDFVSSMYESLIAPAADFMEGFFDSDTNLPHASYDLWEEKFLTSSYTTGLVYRALLASAEIAEYFERPDDALKWEAAAQRIEDNTSLLYDEESKILHKGYLLTKGGEHSVDSTLDVSSLYGFLYFNVPAEGVADATRQAVEERLLDSAPIGGVPRYEGDNYFKSDPQYQGNPWYVTTFWLAQCQIKQGDLESASKLIEWAEKFALSSGMFSEQLDTTNGEPVGVTPLVWSHAEYIRTVMLLDDAERGDESEA